MSDKLVEQIDAVLPQTQCRECQYDGCKPYAKALADGKDSIDHCPPGGVETLVKLADILQIDSAPYIETVKANTRQPSFAKIVEAECIGCTKCIKACPVDAIAGASKQMHTVITSECTGCGLCVEPCPVDCIDLIEVSEPTFDPATARERYEARNARLDRLAKTAKRKHQQSVEVKSDSTKDKAALKKDYILAAVERVKNKKKPS